MALCKSCEPFSIYFWRQGTMVQGMGPTPSQVGQVGGAQQPAAPLPDETVQARIEY